MQTFMPHRDMMISIRCLDKRRLNKQKLEALQILEILLGAKDGGSYKNHPAVLQYIGYEGYLAIYGWACCKICNERGIKDRANISEKFIHYICQLTLKGKSFSKPPYIGNEDYHSSHRAALLAKDPTWYSQFKWSEVPVINYYWPSKMGDIINV